MSGDLLTKYTKIEKLGEGTYGLVYKGINNKTKELVALKKIKLGVEEEGVPSTALREISVLKTMNHPNVVKLLDIENCPKSLYLVFEFMNQDLSAYMKAHRQISAKQVKSFTQQMLLGIEYCHKRGVLHRDIKPQNLLVDKDLNLKLADFGLTRVVSIPVQAYTHEVITLWYRAPEILLGGKHYSIGVDTWSIGCILAELVNKRALWTGDSEIDMLFRIFRTLGTPNEKMWPGVSSLPDFNRSFPKWPKKSLKKIVPNIDRHGQDLFQQLMQYDPVQRMSAKKALLHPYFKGCIPNGHN